jgi:hypothetical protein
MCGLIQVSGANTLDTIVLNERSGSRNEVVMLWYCEFDAPDDNSRKQQQSNDPNNTPFSHRFPVLAKKILH